MSDQPRPKHNWPMQAYRVLGVIDNQVRSLRKRQLIDGYHAGLRKGTYWGIRSDIGDYAPPELAPLPRGGTRRLPASPPASQPSTHGRRSGSSTGATRSPTPPSASGSRPTSSRRPASPTRAPASADTKTVLVPRLLTSLLTDAAGRLDRRYGWDRLPWPLGLMTLIGLRNDLREKNLYDTGRGPLDGRHLRPPALPDRAHARRHVQRPRLPPDGQPRQPLRPQRPARGDGPRAGGQAARAQPAPRQPRADDPPRVPAGDDPQPARGGVDPVHGARLVQPRQERAHNPWLVPLGTRRSLARAPAMHDARARRRDPSADPDRPGRRPTSTDDTHWWDGRRSTAATPPSPAAIRAGDGTASCSSTTGLMPLEIPRPASTSPASPATGGSASRCCTRSSCASTTRICDHLLAAPHPDWDDDRALRQGAADQSPR